MRIIKLEAENVKRLKAVSIEPAGNVVKVGGRNAQGKTSVLDAIATALGGKLAQCEQPVRAGQDVGRIVVTLDGLTVYLRIEADGSRELIVKDSTGKVKNPQTLLDQLTGKLTRDPLAWMKLEPARQVEMFKKLVGLDFADLEAQRKILYDQRADAGRDVTGRQNQLDAMPDYPEAPAREVLLTDLADRLAEAEKHNAALAGLRQAAGAAEAGMLAAESALKESHATRDQWRQLAANLDTSQATLAAQIRTADEAIAASPVIDTAEIEAQIAALQTKLREANEHNAHVAQLKADRDRVESQAEAATEKRDEAVRQAEAWERHIDNRRAALGAAGEAVAVAAKTLADFQPADSEAIRQAMANAQDTNRKVAANAAKRNMRAQFIACKETYENLTKQIDAIDRQKAERLAAVKFPVDGLSFGLHGLLLNGIPFEQCSSAEQLRVSTAMALETCPKRPDAIRVLLIRDGSLLDDGNLRMIADMAEAADAQVWLEIVTEDAGEASVIIEDGMIKGTVAAVAAE